MYYVNLYIQIYDEMLLNSMNYYVQIFTFLFFQSLFVTPVFIGGVLHAAIAHFLLFVESFYCDTY